MINNIVIAISMIRIFKTHKNNIHTYYSNSGNLSLDSNFEVIYKVENSRTGIIDSEYPKIVHNKEIGLSKYGLVEKSRGGYTLVDSIRRNSKESKLIIRSIIDSLLMCDTVIELVIKIVNDLITVNSTKIDSINLFEGISYRIIGEYIEILDGDICVFNSDSGDLFNHKRGELVVVVGNRIIPLHIFEWEDPLIDVVDIMQSKYESIQRLKRIDICNDDLILIPPLYGTILRDKKYEYKSTIELNFDHPSLLDQSIIVKSKYVKGFGRVSSYLTHVDLHEDIVCEEAPWLRCSNRHYVKIKQQYKSISVWIKGKSIYVGSHIIDGDNKWKCIILSENNIYLDSMFISNYYDDAIEILSEESLVMNVFHYDVVLTKDNIMLISGNIGSNIYIYEYCISIYTKGPNTSEEHAQIDHYISSFCSLPYNGPFSTIVSIKNM